jgi:hypothetical protein
LNNGAPSRLHINQQLPRKKLTKYAQVGYTECSKERGGKKLQHKMNHKEVFEYWQHRSVEQTAKGVVCTPHSPLYSWKTKVVQELICRFLPEKGWFLKCDLWNEAMLEKSWFDLKIPPPKDELNFVGIDIAKFVCRSAKKNAPSISVVNADLNHLPFKSSTFNFVLDLSTLDHVSEEEISIILNEIKRILNGTLFTIFHQQKRLQNITTLYHVLLNRGKKEDLSWWFKISYFFNVNWIRHGLVKLGFKLKLQRPLNIGGWCPFTNLLLKRCRGFKKVMNAFESKGFPYSEWMSEYWIIIANNKRTI